MESERRKMYVCSGELAVVLVASGPLDAIRRSLELKGDGVTLDPDYFYLDPRGFREGEAAEYKVPVEQALVEAGFILEDDDEPEGGAGVVPELVPVLPSAEA